MFYRKAPLYEGGYPVDGLMNDGYFLCFKTIFETLQQSDQRSSFVTALRLLADTFRLNWFHFFESKKSCRKSRLI